MRIKINKILLALTCFYGSCFAQDTLKIMVYNLLNYSSTGTHQGRFEDLKTIVAHTKPDILMVCEVMNVSAPQYLLQNSLNAAGIGSFTRAVFFDGNDTDNMLFYRTSKVKLKSQKQILTALREISQYEIYTVPNPGDTAFIYLHMAHLKAGSSPNPPTDASVRDQEVNVFCANIASLSANSNIILGGDLNLKGASEAAWQRLTTNCSHLFYDPINQPGEWYENPTFSHIHTQSTRTNQNPGCCSGATGGLDDRFDFILSNLNVLTGDAKVKYVPGSYEAVGNDNQHYNVSLLDAPTNSAVPANVNQALFNMSDHLPVSMKVAVGSQVIGLKENIYKQWFNYYYYSNNSQHFVKIDVIHSGIYSLEINDLTGKTIYTGNYELSAGSSPIELQKWHPNNGLYILKLSFNGIQSHKLINCIE